MTHRVKHAVVSAALAFGAVLVTMAGVARAQPVAPDQATTATLLLRRTADGGAVLVRTTWFARGRDGRRRGEVLLQRYDARWHAVGRTQVVHRGPPVRTAVAVHGNNVLVAMVNGGESPFVKVSLAAPGAEPRSYDVTRPSLGNTVSPSAVVAADDPEGFTVLWQEEPRDSAGRSASSAMVKVSADGTHRSTPTVAAVPWSLGALAWNGHGYHLAVFYDGSQQGQTRLCLVTLSPTGNPEQHPWWASPAGDPQDVQMLATAEGMVVVYRGGADGTHVYTFTSSQVGQWGQEAPAPRELGRVGGAEPFAAVLASGAPAVVRQPTARPPAG